MKQPIIFSFFAVIMALSAVNCQKDRDVVTLNAVTQEVSNDSKVYINDRTPYWHNGDQIRINDADYTIQTVMENSAQIPNVAVSASGYRAIFPAGILTDSDANINSSSSVAVTLPMTQEFEMVGTHQRVDVPMSAFINSGSTLQFYNLCSVVRVCVSNAMNVQLPIMDITLTAENAYLSGMGIATIMGDSRDAIVIPSATGSHSVSLCKTDDSPMKTVEPLATEYFDVIVPEYSSPKDVTVTVTTPMGKKSITIEDVTLAHNTITTVTVNVDELTLATAELVDGRTFNAAIPKNATAVRFVYNNASVTSGTTLSTATSPNPIYGNLDGTTWVVSTPANRIDANANSGSMFACDNDYSDGYLPALANIDFGSNFNTSNVTNMSGMFGGSSLTSLDLSNFNTSNVTDMSAMFSSCHNLTSLNLSNFNTANVVQMSWMFSGCNILASLDLSNFNTSQVTDMQSMFSYCVSLTNLDLSSFNTSNVTDMYSMFCYCCGLTNLDLSSFNTENVVSMCYMFDSCCSLTSLDLSNFNTANVKTMCGMFNQCSGITRFDLSNFNTANVVNMHGMFRGCSNLTSLDLSSFNTANVESMEGMFSGCSNLTSLDLSSFNTSNVEYMWSMFYNCSSLTSLDLSNFNTSNVWGMGGLFFGCSNLTSLDLSNFNTSNVVNMSGMFDSCINLTSLDLSGFNTANVNDMRGMFYNCNSLSSLDLSSFNTEKVRNMSEMFYNCSRLTSLNLYNFDMSGIYGNVCKDRMCYNLASESGACTITCPAAVKTELQSGTGLDNSLITWYTH